MWNIYYAGLETALLSNVDRAHNVLLGVLRVGCRCMDPPQHNPDRLGALRLLDIRGGEWSISSDEVSLSNILLLTQEN